MKAGVLMTGSQRPIFRTQAVQSYIEHHEEAVLPRLICPRTFLYLWISLGLLLVAGCLVARLVRERLRTPPTAGHQVRTGGG
jgi:hypothetical protein